MNDIQPQYQQQDQSSQAGVKKNADVYSILVIYYIELIESESELKIESGYGHPASKLAGKQYLDVFYKIYHLTKFQLSKPLVKAINLWFSEFRYATQHPITGLPLSRALRDELENSGVILLFSDTVVPPFVSPIDRMGD